ncbi:MAG: hypothetical protein MJZ45_01980 [Bacteroidales bacterium]|nr:hypothetical protein [Bacteroidales bacterium]
MKKVLLGLVAMAMMGMMMTSCQKDEGLSKDTFTATTENGGSKTHLDGLNLKWDDEGESIRVIGMNNGQYAGMAEYVATSVTNDNTCATFACRQGDEVNADVYQIYYPASLITTASLLVPLLPAMQEYVENSVKGFPMYAETQGHAFQFTNLCGLFRLQLQKDDVVVRSISITTDKGVNGVFEVSTNDEGEFQFAASTNNEGRETVRLDCGNGVSIDELTDFNIYLPAGEYSTFDITITATDGSQCVKSLNAGSIVTINRNERVTLTREGDALEFVTPVPEDVVNGLFTVNGNGKQVYFAKGNLQNINGQWQFAEHQYDYFGTYSATAWDHFGWSTAATTFGMSTEISVDGYPGSFVDWGTQIGDGHTWYTLSNDEWNYVLNRDASKKGVGTVTVGTNEIHGLILLPDTWELPAGLNFTSTIGSWTNNQYTTAEWEEMEAAGAVFLPAAGYRYGWMGVFDAESVGLYWTSTPYGSQTAYCVSFYANRVSCTDHNRIYSKPVRLVQDYQGN